MGGFFLARRGCPKELAGAERSFARQGYAPGCRVETPHADIIVYRKRGPDIGPAVHRDAGITLIVTGTLLYRNAAGETACRVLANDIRQGGLDWSEAFGHYCIILADPCGVRLFTDPLGVYHVFHDRALNVVSSSFLALLEALPQATLGAQAVYEYVFQESIYGGATLVDEIALLDRASELRIGPEVAQKPLSSRPRIAPRPAENEGDLAARNLANLRRVFAAIATAFGDRIDTGLSGGYDSRLVLALLREQGVRPNLHVYGAEGDPDVRVAKCIAKGEGLPLVHTDKRAVPRLDEDASAAQVSCNLEAFDGAPADGLFDNGCDLRTRLERCANGELMLNGGGGEIFRDFFYLPERDYSVREFLWAFYSQFDPASMRAPFSAEDFHAALGNKVRVTLDGRATRLSREEVEFLYPAFRCRFWMGRNNSNNNRLGFAMTPFIDANVVPDALAIPLAWKRAGRFEAEMIRRVDPRLAAYPSVYGHDFARPPPLARRARDRLTILRPPWLRRLTFRYKYAQRQPRPYFLTRPYLERVIDVSFPYMSRYFELDRLHHNGQYNRACSLELLCQTYSLR